MTYTEADVEAMIAALVAEGADADPGLHASWRCFDKVRYPEPCTCIRDSAVDILAAVAPAMRDRVRDETRDETLRVVASALREYGDGPVSLVESMRSGGDQR
jgi:hypothetical protein